MASSTAVSVVDSTVGLIPVSSTSPTRESKSKTSVGSLCCKVCVDSRNEPLFEPCRLGLPYYRVREATG